jgi:hypothetical protein
MNVGRAFLVLLILPTILLGAIVIPGMDWAEAAGGEYFVATDGNDNNPGTFSQPWRTIDKANRTLQAGDTVYIRQGIYEEIIEPFNTGTIGNKITYTNYQDEEVILRGEPDAAPVITIGWSIHSSGSGGKSYIVIDGFIIRHVIPSDQMPENDTVGIRIWGETTHHIEIRNNKIYGDPQVPRQHGISIGKSSDNIIEHNTIDGVTRIGIIIGGGPNGTDRNNIIRNNIVLNSSYSNLDVGSSKENMHELLIENNILCGSKIEDGIQFEHDYSLDYDYGSNRGVVIRNNVICNNAENAVDLKGAAYVVVEGNIIWGNRGDNNGEGNLGGGAGGIMKGGILSCQAHDILIRRNVIYDNKGGITIHNYNWVVYHNTIVGNNHPYLGPDISAEEIETYSHARRLPLLKGISMVETHVDHFSGSVIKNNIIGGNHQGEISVRTTADLSEAEIDGNLYFNSDGVLLVDVDSAWHWERVAFETFRDRLRAIPGPIGDEEHSFTVVDPGLVVATDAPIGEGPFDFSLQSDSPAIDSGLFLTSTLSAGSGNQLHVVSANYFFDGYDIVDGDLIQLEGQKTIAQITSIDYETNTITVDRELSWAAGQGVSLAYHGAAPDMGAYEFDPGEPTPTFVDVPLAHWAYDYIETLYQDGYTAGCSLDPFMYCPEATMTRAESAVFVERGIHGAETLPDQPTEQIFADVPLTEWYAKWVMTLWNDGYTAGCGTDPLIYCPLEGHTRAEGIVFFLRMMHGADYVPPEPVGLFKDVPIEAWYADWAEAAYDAGIIPACQTEPDLLFCPEEPLDRAMAAYMMVQAKGLHIP